MSAPLITRSFTVDQYHRMAEAGILGEDDRVELLDGRVVEMTPIGPRHARCVDDLNRLLARRAGDAAIVRVQNPIVPGQHDEPEPDLALLRHRPDRYGQAHPRAPDTLLVIEVAETPADADRQLKIPRYAAAGIADVWLVDREHERLKVYRTPRPEGFQEVRILARGRTYRGRRDYGIADRRWPMVRRRGFRQSAIGHRPSAIG